MIERFRQVTQHLGHDLEADESASTHLTPLWVVAAQLLLATGAGATLEQLASNADGFGDARAPKGLVWAPLLVAPLAAAANLEHARHPSDRSETAVRFLTGASIGLGAALFAFDTIVNHDRPPRRIGPLAFASAGLLGFVLDREEREIDRTERALERRARVVERFVPRRKPKLDRIVVHV